MLRRSVSFSLFFFSFSVISVSKSDLCNQGAEALTTATRSAYSLQGLRLRDRDVIVRGNLEKALNTIMSHNPSIRVGPHGTSEDNLSYSPCPDGSRQHTQAAPQSIVPAAAEAAVVAGGALEGGGSDPANRSLLSMDTCSSALLGHCTVGGNKERRNRTLGEFGETSRELQAQVVAWIAERRAAMVKFLPLMRDHRFADAQPGGESGRIVAQVPLINPGHGMEQGGRSCPPMQHTAGRGGPRRARMITRAQGPLWLKKWSRDSGREREDLGPHARPCE